MGSNDERATPARIRDAAISYVGKHGWDRATSRQIAAEAGVPVGLVNYHFGSKDGLRRACDDWVIERVGEDKGLLLSSGLFPQLDTYIEDHPELRPMSAYIAMSLRHGGSVADHLFESMVTLTKDTLELAADAGTMRRFDDPYAMAVLLVAYGAGASLFGPTIARLLGGTDLLDPATYARYGRTTIDLFTKPLLTHDPYQQSLPTPNDPDLPTPKDTP